jgi:hypothetical protein
MIYCNKKKRYVDQSNACIAGECKSYIPETDSCKCPEQVNKPSQVKVKDLPGQSLEQVYQNTDKDSFERGFHD